MYCAFMILSLALFIILVSGLFECLCQWHTYATCIKSVIKPVHAVCKYTAICFAVSAGHTTALNVQYAARKGKKVLPALQLLLLRNTEFNQTLLQIHASTSCENKIIMFVPINRKRRQHNKSFYLIIITARLPYL